MAGKRPLWNIPEHPHPAPHGGKLQTARYILRARGRPIANRPQVANLPYKIAAARERPSLQVAPGHIDAKHWKHAHRR